ncbi:beta-propeller fold lactonase family protein [Nocardia aurea]|uniref:Beta-propeller fold lactonase family protein n=2 Tax=Nocardiaceae TaxID=85025 RepID=A0ABV3FR57_9NOCA
MTGMKALSLCLAAGVVAACGSGDFTTGLTLDRVVAISDGDYLASTYADGILPPAEAGHRDLLTTTGIIDGIVRTQEIEISNSVTAAPEVLALSPDGSTAFVAERLGRRGSGDTMAGQLPPGNQLAAVRISEENTMTVAASATIAPAPEAIAVSPDGHHIAVVSNSAEATRLQLIPWSGTAFGTPADFDLAGLGITGNSPGPRGGVLATNVQWHPGGRALAVNITTQDRVAFFSVDARPNGTVAVAPWGAPVRTGPDPFVGRFTPDGRHYLTSDWGRDLAATTLADRLPSDRSKLGVIRLGEPGTTARHRVVATADTDKSAEGLAISPDGTHIATVNMRGSAFPPGSPGYDEYASVTLLRMDGATGAVTKIGDYPLRGVLPEGGAFDPTGEYFLATVFQGRGPQDPGPGIEIFRVGSDEQPGLTPVQRIPLPHGVHHVAVG